MEVDLMINWIDVRLFFFPVEIVIILIPTIKKGE